MKRKLILIISIILLFGAISSVSANDDLNTNNGTFKDLDNLIQSSDELYLNNTHYIQNNASYGAIKINKNITINGGNKETGGYSILNGNHLTNIFTIAQNSSVTLINIKFMNSYDKKYGSIYNNGNLTLINSTFENNTGLKGNDISNYELLSVDNCKFTTKNGKWGSIYIEEGNIDIKNSNFTDSESKYSAGIHFFSQLDDAASIKILNCIFENTTSNITAGAIGIKGKADVLIKNSIFKSTKSAKNAGAILSDDVINLIIENCSFNNGSSDFGGSLVILNTENVKIINCNFTNNSANYNGGVIYTSFTNTTILNSSFNSNKGIIDSNGGAIYSDASYLILNNTNFISNQVTDYGSGIFLYQSNMTLTNSEFRKNKGENNSLIYSVFSGNIILSNNTYDNGSISLNNTFYINDVSGEASKITFVNNTIILENLPSKFDLRDYGWVTPVKNQGLMAACWAFATIGALESALLKATGIQYNLSENNLQDLMIKNSNIGTCDTDEEGEATMCLNYLVSWLGPVNETEDKFDELGKISQVLDSNIHIQNAILVNNDRKTDIDLIKRTIIEYGAVTYSFFWDGTNFNSNTNAYYDNGTKEINHCVIIVGWDDNYSKDNFKTTPPGDGAFIIKNCWGEEFGDKGYFYLSYYNNKNNNSEFAFKITNETYNINYQHGIGGKINSIEFPYYASEFESIGNDLISAFGTYFNQTTNYKIKLYINDILKYKQEGENEFAGYNSIHLNEKIPVRKDDIIRIEVKQLNTPVTNDTRVVLEKNVAFISEDGEKWIDASKNQSQGIPLIKVYTEATDLMTEDIEKYYKNGTQFEALAIGDDSQGLANQTITFTINGVSYKRTTNSDGIAKLNINLNPGVYEIETKYGNTSVLNNVTVLSTIEASNLVKYFQNGSQFIAKSLDNTGNPVAGKKLTFNINGVLYNRTTNEEGIAKLNINLNPGKYVLTATDLSNGLEQSYNITVLPRLKGENIKMNYRDGTKYNVKLVSETGTPLEGEEITLNINGVFYNKITNDDGVASLAINLMPGAYIITAYYKNEATSNIIWVT